jgi:CRAL/TRIO domain
MTSSKKLTSISKESDDISSNSAPPTNDHLGMAPISERKQNLCNDFYEQYWKKCAAKHPYWPQWFKDLDEDNSRIWCQKLMIARDFNLDKANEMLRHICEYRREYKCDEKSFFPPAIQMRGYDMNALKAFFRTATTTLPPDENVITIQHHLRCAYNPVFHKWTKWGHPVVIESYGQSNPDIMQLKMKQLAPVGCKISDISCALHSHSNELAVRLTHYMDTTWAKPRGSRVLGLVSIVDVKGLSLAHLGSENIGLITAMFDMDAKAYPEFLTKVLVVNCSTFIRFAYSLVKMFLPTLTQQKIEFFAPGEATIDGLKAWINEEDIPVHLGGKCNCDGGCVNIPSKEDVEAAMKATGGVDKLAEVDVIVPAGQKLEREYTVKVGDEVVWEWESKDQHTVNFTVQFVGSEKLETKNVHETVRLIKHSGSWFSTHEGIVKIIFSNEFSWIRDRSLTFRIFTVLKPCDLDIYSSI